MQQIPTRTLVAVPYDQMVRNLFKPMETEAATVLHAAVGIAGEVAELLVARSIEDIVEEMGDVEFYVEAAFQATGGRHFEEIVVEGHDMAHHQVFNTVGIALSVSAGRLLDLAKKSWVYNQAPNLSAMRYELLRIQLMLGTMRELVSVRLPDVLGANQAKLGKRYPDGVYTDRDAQQRADKPGESDVD